MAEISGPARDWLAAHRDELNARFKTSRRRFGKLDPQTVLALLAELLPPLALNDNSSELLSVMNDLILLHAGRGLLSDGSPLRILLSDTFPKLREQLLKRPRQLPAALSNAVENLGSRGGEFARVLSAIAPQLTEPDQVLDAGAVLAWRLGEARLRESALKAASQIPNAAALAALGLEGWPPGAAPLAVAALMGDAWSKPLDRVSLRTLDQLDRMPRQKVLTLLEQLAAPTTAPLSEWRKAGTCGEFEGYGGNFTRPPLLLNAAGKNTRHRFWVRSAETNFRIDADIFGFVCKPDASADFPIQTTQQSAGLFSKLGLSKKSVPNMLFGDGTFNAGKDTAKFSDLAGATSFNVSDGCFAATLADSFRIRIFAPARSAL